MISDDELIAALTKRYEPTEVPPCRVCGAKLAIAAVGGGRPTKYTCSSQRIGNGKPFDFDHYDNSVWEDRRQGGDADVMELISRYRAVALSMVVSPNAGIGRRARRDGR